jgi:hypothetical protein
MGSKSVTSGSIPDDRGGRGPHKSNATGTAHEPDSGAKTRRVRDVRGRACARGADAGGGPPRAAGERKTKPQGPGGACQNTELCVTTLSTVVAASFFF